MQFSSIQKDKPQHKLMSQSYSDKRLSNCGSTRSGKSRHKESICTHSLRETSNSPSSDESKYVIDGQVSRNNQEVRNKPQRSNENSYIIYRPVDSVNHQSQQNDYQMKQVPKSSTAHKQPIKHGSTAEPLNGFTDKASLIRKRSKKNTQTQRGS